MKTILNVVLAVFSLSFSAQTIPNASFENWNPYNAAYPTQVPQHWWSYDLVVKAFHPAYSGTSMLQTNQSHSGASALLLQTNISGTDTINGFVYASDSAGIGSKPQGFSYNQRPATFSGYYKLNATGGDTAGFIIVMTKWNGNHRDTIAVKAFALATNSSSYIPFSFPLTYLLNQVPDTAYIAIGIVGPSNKVSHLGTKFYVDDILFSGSVPLGIKENSKENNLVSFYPTPFSNTAILKIDNSVNLEHASVIIYDINGKEVKKINPSAYQTNISREGLNNGIYFYKLVNGATVSGTGKFVIE